MRRVIILRVKENRPGADVEFRLFKMSEAQSMLFHDTTLKLVESGRMTLQGAAAVIEKVVISMLEGKVPASRMPAVFHQMRVVFPTLKAKAVRALPRAGCPRGPVKALVTQVVVKKSKEARTVLIEFDRDQVAFYADAMREVMDQEDITKDEAWLWLNNLIGQLLAGCTLKNEKTEELILMRAVALFPGMTEKAALALPLATEEDVERWSFTRDRAR